METIVWIVIGAIILYYSTKKSKVRTKDVKTPKPNVCGCNRYITSVMKSGDSGYYVYDNFGNRKFLPIFSTQEFVDYSSDIVVYKNIEGKTVYVFDIDGNQINTFITKGTAKSVSGKDIICEFGNVVYVYDINGTEITYYSK